jgi:hypothetical protein
LLLAQVPPEMHTLTSTGVITKKIGVVPVPGAQATLRQHAYD